MLSLILLSILIGTGLILYIHHRLTANKQEENNPTPPQEVEDECCGMHITCERDSLLAAVSPDIEYYDDEELDQYAERGEDEYNEVEIEEFREVMLTMRPEEIAGWARSLQLRKINLPTSVREELIMIVAEERTRRTTNQQH